MEVVRHPSVFNLQSLVSVFRGFFRKMKFAAVFALVTLCVMGAMALPYSYDPAPAEEAPLVRVARAEIIKNRKFSLVSKFHLANC